MHEENVTGKQLFSPPQAPAEHGGQPSPPGKTKVVRDRSVRWQSPAAGRPAGELAWVGNILPGGQGNQPGQTGSQTSTAASDLPREKTPPLCVAKANKPHKVSTPVTCP